ncbi:uncharacterized protein MYCFIDRAFT_169572 [Pseudocercospora fijiensis CIRAD86]|uniref:Uncharacterized protein n=1 Tax=Pseudocercospora fijiensis (strain CIRAD86) TaxID=383855 RepID=N1QAA4_PSEFD|nr:uncharacterized protein MYCFIDRAFT_169572 [Pseudocercospora fijiensis CIRAD86]EME87827.1 hypothetical protein MYCFIDRAFT_169572 [Pseudocercospora fijiensis CIRAD86]
MKDDYWRNACYILSWIDMLQCVDEPASLLVLHKGRERLKTCCCPAQLSQLRPHPQDGLARSQIVQTGPLAQVQCILNNDGEWMLRTYINDSDIERIRLERIQGVQHSIESEDRSGTSLAQVMTLSDGVILKPFRGSLLASANTKKRSSGVLKGNGQQGAEKGTTAPARRKIRLRDNSTTLYDPNIMPDFSAVKMVKPDITALFKGTSTTGWDGVVPNEAGKWHFHTCGGNEWTDSSEGIAAAEMGGQGIFEPDTNHPTAQDVYDYKKCYKRHGKGVADRSQNVTIVWRPDSWPLAHQRTQVEDAPAEAIAGAVSGQVVDFAASSNGASAANEVPVSPRSGPAPNDNNARTTHLENVEDSSGLMPPPANPFDPAGNTLPEISN